MHDFLTSIVLGVVEGVTEFLPISSTGHLILVNRWFGFEPGFEKLFDVFIQLGAILAVVLYFWNKLWPFSARKTPAERAATWSLWLKVIVAVCPALVFGFLLGDIIESKLFNPAVVSAALIGWGAVIIIVDRKKKVGRPAKIGDVSGIGYGTALLIGVIQCLAMVPGTSRSAMTIIGALLLGCSRMAAAEFSFFLAIPTMVAASGYTLLKHGSQLQTHDLLVLGTGFVVAFATALVVISGFMKFIGKHRFTAFGWYRIALGACVIAAICFGVL